MPRACSPRRGFASRDGATPLGSRSSCAIVHTLHALVLGAMGAAINLAPGFDAMADHPAIAVGAMRRHGVDRALEAVEGHGACALGDAKSLVIVVTADVASGHHTPPVLMRQVYFREVDFRSAKSISAKP